MIPVVLRQHVEDAAILHATRTLLTTAPHVKLHHLRRCDERLEAHLDGLLVAAELAWPLCEEALEVPSAGAIFTATVRAVESRETTRLDRLIALAQALPEVRRGLISALGWLEAHQLRGLVLELLGSSDPFRQLIGVSACAVHRVDPGSNSFPHVAYEDPALRARAWRMMGELGKRALVSRCTQAIADEEDPACQFWAAWSAVVLGDRERALELVASLAGTPGPFRTRAFQLAIQAMSLPAAHELLRPMRDDPESIRWMIRGAALAGDPRYVPWLLGFMENEALARLAGEAFSLIAGADLAWLDLERKPPEQLETGPNDDPEDSNVEMDDDDGLPWPDAARVRAWWEANSHRFQSGTRYFIGEPLNREHCLRVLKEGYQRQRLAAALYLSLLSPGTPLFECRAPARRQQRSLAQM